MRNKGVWVWTCAAIVSFGCGRSELLSTFQSETELGGDAAGTRATGGRTAGGRNGAGGTVGTSGTFGFAGTFGEGGSLAQAGMPSGIAGSPSTCSLAVGNCASEREPDCSSNPLCTGSLLAHQLFGDTGEVHVLDVVTAPDGRIAICGDYQGSVDFGGASLPLGLPSAVGYSGSQSFVASFNAMGTAEWARAYNDAGSQSVTGVDFAPNGDVVMRGRGSNYGAADADQPSGYALRLDREGVAVWQQGWYDDVEHGRGRVAIDNDGRTWISGTFNESIDFEDARLYGPGAYNAYLLQLDAKGATVGLSLVAPSGWLASAASSLAVDDEDNLVFVGEGIRADQSRAVFVQKRSPDGQLLFSKELTAPNLRVHGLAIDREMRIVLAGDFTGILEAEGGKVQGPPAPMRGTWIAQYSRAGKLLWQQVISGDDGDDVTANAVAVDPFGNIVLVGAARDLLLGDDVVLRRNPEHPADAGAYVLKLRPDGSFLWARAADGRVTLGAVATENAGYIWVGGSFNGRAWLGNSDIDNTGTEQGLLLRVSP